MKRTRALPEYLVPWFVLAQLTGVARCVRCHVEFVGKETTDSALALHVSMHIGAAKTERNTAVTKSVDDNP
jgi:hypothetical protein